MARAVLPLQALPLEIYGCIVDEIPGSDICSLRECSLAASVFRRLCQERLFSDLWINLGTPTYDMRETDLYLDGDRYKYRPRAINEMLDESPHLADYFATVCVSLPNLSSSWAEHEPDMRRLLQRLTSIHTMTIEGRYPAPKALTIVVIQWLLDIFQAHKELEYLKYRRTDITSSLLRQSLGAATELTFREVGVFKDVDGNSLPSISTPTKPPLTELNIIKSPAICALLAQPSFGPYLWEVCDLYQNDIERDDILPPCFAVAATLERLQCYFDDLETVPSFPASLPRLRELVFSMPRHSYDLPAVLVNLLAQGGVPSLVNLELRLKLYAVFPDKLERQFQAQATLYKEFDDAIVMHPTLKAVEWFFSRDCDIAYEHNDKGKDDSDVENEDQDEDQDAENEDQDEDQDNDDEDDRHKNGTPWDAGMILERFKKWLPKAGAKGLLLVDGERQ
ncbi:hypothetical protein MIND_00513500 [Mycena indigotica]|uniref:F-box domain-containing protein n=1 Tax=Mycena indigotica TaxID=2126181 RepID=A0A8H6W636_9AGAR|nr:uncharacterized protein MIND_00513500 [Mycena indigotica]KAF7307199.1 hypothetical protein MIND_00513500 [Mycena indigotica]